VAKAANQEEPSAVHTIDSLLQESCRKHAASTALRQKVNNSWQEITYAELWNSSDRIAAGLIQGGFKPGQHAALLAPSSPRWVFAYLGVLKAGGVVIPVDKELKSAELRHILTDCEATVIFTDRPHLDTLLECVPSLPQLERIIMLHPAQSTSGDPRTAKALESLLEEWQGMVTSLGLPAERVARLEALASQVHRLFTAPAGARSDTNGVQDPFSPTQTVRKELVKQGRLCGMDAILVDTPIPANQRTAQDTAVILYTSGTTGRSKGAMLSHGNIVSNLQGAASHFCLDDTIHTLSFLPINHVFEQVAGVLLPLSLGGKVTFAESLKKLGENLAEVKPTFFLGVPAVYRLILDRIRKNIGAKHLSQFLFSFPVTRPLVTAKIKQAFGSGTIFISGGAALDPAVAKGFLDLGLSIYQGYGITETSPVITAEQPRGQRLGTVGRVLPGVSVRLDNPNEENVGEIVVKGPNVMQGYYKNPQATAEVLQDGWYRTGDLGRLDADGYLTICGRVKNLIVTPNGKNVYPEEVENELLKRPFIAEVMVYGHKVAPLAEEVHAIIYPNQEEIDDYGRKRDKGPMTVADVEALIRAEVQAACNGLADYKRVKKFTLREDEFPKTTTRKIKRFVVEASISMHD
jgi:long-chain acyl-CoA synthetase